MKKFGFAIVFALLTVGVAPSYVSAGNSELKAAAKEATKAFSETSFVAKVNLRRYADHFVLPDGSPAPKKAKKQGRGGEGAIQLDSGVKVRAGETGESIFIARVTKDQIQVGFNEKRGKVLNAVLVHIMFDRPVTPEDFDPDRIALAVSSVADIEGFGPTEALDEALAEIDEAAQSVAESSPVPNPPMAPAAPQGSTILRLAVEATPNPVRLGREVELVLRYECQGSSDLVDVTETWTLELDGQELPSYPYTESVRRGSGPATASYLQPIPTSARPGTYRFVGEVCVGGDCIKRSTDLVVER